MQSNKITYSVPSSEGLGTNKKNTMRKLKTKKGDIVILRGIRKGRPMFESKEVKIYDVTDGESKYGTRMSMTKRALKNFLNNH